MSVIVSAWSRSEFLSDALASVDRQALDGSRDELILNTNLPAETAQRFIAGRSNARLLPNTSERQGPFYAAATRAARGEVIAFLDDDDRWTGGRIAAVRSEFAHRSRLAYFHNSQRRILRDGAAEPVTPTATRLAHRPPSELASIQGPVTPADLQRLLEWGAFFNLSSTCVRKSAVLPFLGTLERMGTNDDSFYFYAALLSGGEAVLDPRALTEYRVHGSNRSRDWEVRPAVPRAEAWPERAVESHELLLGMARDSANAAVIRAVEHDLALMRLLADVARRSPGRREAGADLLRLLQRASVGSGPLNAGFALMGAAQVLSPRLGRLVHARLRK